MLDIWKETKRGLINSEGGQCFAFSINQPLHNKRVLFDTSSNLSLLQKTGLSGTLVASLELVREGELLIKQKNIYDKIFIKKK